MQTPIKINQLAPLGFSIVVFVTIITTLFSKWTMSNIYSSLDWVNYSYLIKENLAVLEKELIDAETGQRGFIITGQEKFLEPYLSANQTIPIIFPKLRQKILLENKSQQQKILTPQEEELIRKQIINLETVEKLSWQRLEELSTNIALKKANKDTEVEAAISTGQGKATMDSIRAELDKMNEIEDALLVERQKTAVQAQLISNYFIWGSIVLIIAVGFAISWVISRIVNRALALAVEVADRVSSGDLSTRFEVVSDDSIGQLLAALQKMTQNLNSLISQVQQSGVQVTTSTTQIAASGKQLEATAVEQVAASKQVMATVKEIVATSEELVKTIDEVTAMAQGTTMAASKGQNDLIRMETTMHQLIQATSSISSKLGVISEKANNINTVVTTITKVADRTNLLSLNAAIEAEKAGEYGTGFAVVAREIRRLADQTAVATLDIESMVKDMQSAVSTGVMEMDKFTKEVSGGMEDIRIIGAAQTQIIDRVQALAPRFQLVNQGMEDQSERAQQINEAMSQLSEASSQTALSLREINGAIEQLKDVTRGLQKEISYFKIK